MEHRTSLPCLVLVVMVAQLPANAQHQTVVDAPDLSVGYRSVLPAPEEGTYATAHHEGDLTVFRFNADGTLAWERVLDQVPGDTPNEFVNVGSIIPGSEGGVVVNGYGTPYIVEHTTSALDTATVRHVFTELSAQGDINAMWTLTKLMVHQTIVTNTSEARRAIREPNGGYYLLLDYFGVLPSQELLRLSATGELLWARSIGIPNDSPGFAELFPTLGELGLPAHIDHTQLLCSASGDVYIMNLTNDPFSAVKVKKVTPTGELAWVRTYEFIGIDPSGAKCMSATLDGTGNLHVQYRYPGSQTAMRIGPEGELLSVDAFDLNGGFEFTLMVAGNGERFIGVIAINPNENALFHLAAGGVLERTMRPIVAQDPYLVYTNAMAWDLTNDRIRMAATLEREHQDFNTFVRYPLILNLPVEDFVPCESFNSNYQYLSVPLENISVSVSTVDVAVDITDLWSSAPSTVYTISTPQPHPLADLCGIALGVADEENGGQHHVRQNLLTSGEPILVDVSAPTRIDIIGVDGRAMATANIAIGSNAISTAPFAAGMYLVRASDMDGHVRWCERVTLH